VRKVERLTDMQPIQTRGMVMLLNLALLLLLPTIMTCGGTESEGAPAVKAIRWINKYEDALAKAKKENKPVLLDLYTDWCGWCKKMDVSTYTDPQVIAVNRRMIFLKLNAETDPDGIELQRRMNVYSFPTTMLLDSNGEEIDRIPGYLTAEMFVKAVDQILNDKDSIPSLKKQEAENGNDVDILYRLGRRYYEKESYEQAKVRFERIILKDPQNKSKRTDEAYFLKALCSANLGEMNEAMALLERLKSSFPASKYAPEADLVYGEILMKSRRSAEAKKVFQQFLQKYPKHKLAEEVRQMLTEL